MASATEVFGDSRPGDVDEFFASSKKNPTGQVAFLSSAKRTCSSLLQPDGSRWCNAGLKGDLFFKGGGGLSDMGFSYFRGSGFFWCFFRVLNFFQFPAFPEKPLSNGSHLRDIL